MIDKTPRINIPPKKTTTNKQQQQQKPLVLMITKTFMAVNTFWFR